MNIEDAILKLITENLDVEFVEDVLLDTKKEDLNIFDDLGYDSLTFIELVIKLEGLFQIEFDQYELFTDNFGNYSEIVHAVETLLDKKTDGE